MKSSQQLMLALMLGGAVTNYSSVAHASDASNNHVTVTRSTYTVNDGAVTEHTGTVGDVYAGYSGYYSGDIIGGASDSGNASGNVLEVSDVSVVGGEITAGMTSVGNANNNVTTVTNVDAPYAFLHGGYAYAGDGTSNNNTVNFHGGTVYEIHGGHAASGTANGNVVNITDGTVLSIVGAGYSNLGDANENELNIEGGTMNGVIHGGYAPYGDGANANGNTVNISGGTINGDVYGGWAPYGNASNNIIDISGTPDLTQATLYAGKASATGNSNGNTLNIRTKDLTAQNIAGFENLNFVLPSNTSNGDTVLRLTSADGTDLTNTKVNVDAGGNLNLSTGDTITLLANDNGISTSNITNSGLLSEGVSFDYVMNLSETGGGKGTSAITATIGERTTDGLKAQTEALAQGLVVGPDLVNRGTDRLINWLPPEDLEAVVADPKNEFRIFADMSGSLLRTTTGSGSYVDSKTGGMDMGWARAVDNGQGKLVFAPIIDYGTDCYNSHLSNGIEGNGHSKYYAGGMIARQINDNGFYYEGSFRVGRVETSFASNDFMQGDHKTHVDYNLSAPCYAGHVHLGRMLQIDKRNRLDVYGMYFHTHQGSTSTELSTGETYHFAGVTSSRARVGVRLTMETSKGHRFYSGMAYQYEKNGDARGSYHGYSTPTASTSGSSGMIEFGWQIKPVENTPWMVDVNATGWIGMQKGVSITAKIKKAF